MGPLCRFKAGTASTDGTSGMGSKSGTARTNSMSYKAGADGKSGVDRTSYMGNTGGTGGTSYTASTNGMNGRSYGRHGRRSSVRSRPSPLCRFMQICKVCVMPTKIKSICCKTCAVIPPCRPPSFPLYTFIKAPANAIILYSFAVISGRMAAWSASSSQRDI